MSRYFTQPPRAYVADDLWPEDAPMIPTLSVSDHQAVDTGLVNATGDTIWRAPNPIGFGRDGEW